MKHLPQLLTGDPVMLNDKIGIHQLTIKEIIGTPELDQLLEPFTIDVETVDIGLRKRPQWTYDLFTMIDEKTGEPALGSNNTSYIAKLMIGFKVLCKVEDIEILDNGAMVLDNSFVVTKLNFDKIAEIVRELYCREREVGEKPPESPRQYQIWKETMEGRQKKISREAPSIYDIINIVAHYGYNIRYKETLGLTLWQLFNSFEQLNTQDSYNEFRMYSSSSMVKIKEKDRMRHWTITSRLLKKK